MYFSSYPYTEELFSLSIAWPQTGGSSGRQWLGRSGDFVEVDTARWPSPEPTGLRSMWVATTVDELGTASRFTYVVDGEIETSVEIAGGLHYPTEDDSLLIVEHVSPGPAALIRLMTDGTIAWRVPLVNPDGTRFPGVDPAPTVDRHGVFYAAAGSSGSVIAVQTDTLPPPDGTCFVNGCNARRDFAMYYPTE